MSTYNISSSKSKTRFAPIIARVVMGLLFTVTGLNGFLNFIPQPAEAMPPGAVAMMTGFLGSGYMMPLIAGTQLVSGVLLLSGFFVPLGLVILAPMIVNIFAFHFFLLPSGTGMAIVVAILELFLAWSYRKAFAPLFKAR